MYSCMSLVGPETVAASVLRREPYVSAIRRGLDRLTLVRATADAVIFGSALAGALSKADCETCKGRFWWCFAAPGLCWTYFFMPMRLSWVWLIAREIPRLLAAPCRLRVFCC